MENTWVHNFNDFKMTLSKSDTDIAPQIQKFGWYEDEKFETEVFAKNLKKDMTVLDLGANIGFYSLLARSVVGPGGNVYSFEPFPENISLLRQSIHENKFENMTLIEAAVSDKSGESFLYLSPDACSEHSMLDLDFDYNKNQSQKKLKIQALNIDDYFVSFDDKIDFIKMDIEGSEFRALDGMKKTLEQNQQISIMTEFWPNGFRKDGKAPQDFLKRLVDLGFELFHIDSSNSTLAKKTPEQIMNVEKNNHSIIQKNPVMKKWGWYTNLFCTRN